MSTLRAWAACGVWVAIATATLAAPPAEFVIQISVDGLGSGYAQRLIDDGQLPNFARIQAEGAWTNNARTDFDFTITLPNHTCMVTGRSVRDKVGNPHALAGHTWVTNIEPGEKTLHSVRHDYVASTFDVAHDRGRRTCMFASKTKFKLYDQSYDGQNGAPDKVDEDNGRDKMDQYLKEESAGLTEKFVAEMRANPFHYSFLHFHDTDSAGHAKGWGSAEYNAAAIAVDGYLGQLLQLVTSDERLKDKTAIIISADHGGLARDHFDSRNPLDYTIPFYTWGAGVAKGKDLYALNSASRQDPGTSRPDYTDPGLQPIRNGDGGNLAMWLLGLPAIPDSTINAAQDLKLQ